MLAGYANYVDVAIQNPSPSAVLTDFPLPLRVSVPAAHLQFADCRDIRVTSADGLDTAIPFGLKTHATSGGTTNLFILCMPASIPSGSGTVLTLRVYYNNPSAANGENRSGVCDSSTLLNMPLGGSGSIDLSDWTGRNTITPTNVTPGAGLFGGAGSFAGNEGDGIVTSLDAQLGDFTFETWFKILGNGYSGYSRLIDKDFQFGAWLGNNGNPNNYVGGVMEASPPYGGAQVLPDGSWHYLALTRSGSTRSVYGDNNSPVAGSVTSALLGPQPVYLGRSAATDSYNDLNGLLSDSLVHNVARSAAWCQARYAYGLDGSYLSQTEQATTPPPRHGGSIFQAPHFACPQFTSPCTGA